MGKLPTTIHSNSAATRALCACLLDEGIIVVNTAIKISKPKLNPPKRDAISDAEVTAIFRACQSLTDDWEHNIYPAVLAVLAHSGLRAAELLALRLSDLNQAQGTIRVQCGKGGKTRVAYPAAEIWPILLAYLAYRPSLKPSTDALFLAKKGTVLACAIPAVKQSFCLFSPCSNSSALTGTFLGRVRLLSRQSSRKAPEASGSG